MSNSSTEPPNSNQSILQLNQSAMELLSKGEIENSLHILHKANFLIEESDQEDLKLKGMTLNNLGCLYKRLQNHEKSLTYLSNALDCQYSSLSDPLTIAGTHLNICSIWSQLDEHEKALGHAMRTINLLKNYSSQSESSANTLLIAYNNAGFEYEAIKEYEEASKIYYEGWKLGVELLGRNHELTVKLLKQCGHLASFAAKDKKTIQNHILKEPPKAMPRLGSNSRMYVAPMIPPNSDLSEIQMTPRARKVKARNFRFASHERANSNGRPKLEPIVKEEQKIRPNKKRVITLGSSFWKPAGIAPHNGISGSPYPIIKENPSKSTLSQSSKQNLHKEPSILKPKFRKINNKKRLEQITRSNLQGPLRSVKPTAKKAIKGSSLSKVEFDKRIKNIGRELSELHSKIDSFEYKFGSDTGESSYRIRMDSGDIRRSQNFARAQAAYKIEIFYRAWKLHKMFQQKKKSALLIQKNMAGFYYRQKYRRIREKMNKLPGILRILLKNKEMTAVLKPTKECLKIEKVFRMFCVKEKFLKEKAVLYIQKKFRSFYRKKQINQKRSFCLLSKYIEFNRAKRKVKKTRNCRLVEKISRYFMSKMIYRKEESCRKIQKRFRSMIQIEKKNLVISKIIRIQSKFREITNKFYYDNIRKEYYQASVVIQKDFKRWRHRKTFEWKKETTNLHINAMQKLIRGIFAKDEYEKMKTEKNKANRLIYRWYRGWKARQEVKKYKEWLNSLTSPVEQKLKQIFSKEKCQILKNKTNELSLKIQTLIRMFETYKNSMNKSSLIIQKAFKKFLFSLYYKNLRYLMNRAAFSIQRSFKTYKILKDFKTKKEAALTIERIFRGHQGRLLSDKIQTLMGDPSYWARAIIEASDEESSVEFIHVNYRCAHINKKSGGKYNTELCLKCESELGLDKKRNFSEEFADKTKMKRYKGENANSELKGCLKGYLMRIYIRKHISARKIQAHARGFLVKRNYQYIVDAVIVLQKNARMWRVKKIYRSIRNAVIFIEEFYLMYKERERHHSERDQFIHRVYYSKKNLI